MRFRLLFIGVWLLVGVGLLFGLSILTPGETAEAMGLSGSWLFWLILLVLVMVPGYGTTYLMRRNWRVLLRERVLLATVTGNMAEGLYVEDSSGAILFANRAAEKMLGAEPGGLTGRSGCIRSAEALDSNSVAAVPQDAERGHVLMRRLDGSAFPVAYARRDIKPASEDPRILRSTGGVFGPALEQLTTWFAQFDDWMEGNAAGAEIVGRVVVTFTDITAQQEQEQTLRKLSMAVEQSSASVVITDINGIIEYVNQTFERISGYSAEEAVGKTPRILRSGKVPPATYKELWTTITAGQEWRGEMENRRKDGTYYWESTVVSPIRDDQGQITHFVAVKDDITDRKVMQDELFRQANYDSLTGLPNRQLALDRLRQALAPLTRGEKSQIGILFMDLDHFKKVNDTQGHDAGDALLQEASMRFRTVLRPQDTLARLGGDEFLIILPELPGASMAAAIASRLINCAQAPFFINGHEHHLSSSVGVAMAPADGTEPESLLKNADAAMYRAKDQGRGVSYFFTSDVAESISRRLVLERRLRETLRETAKDGEGHGLKLNLQPLMNIQRGDIEGCEVLCRWVDQELGPVSPGEFIPVAEECGLVEDLGQWILNEACHQAAMIQPWVDPGFRVCINASPIQFSRDSYPGQVRSALERSGVEPGLLEIEITERLILDRSGSVFGQLKALRDMGVGLAVDDFGTGYSALSYLHAFDFDTLKIDRSFVLAMMEDDRAKILTRAIIDMANGLGVRVVGEGVETEHQIDELGQLGCIVFQGYAFAKPMAPEDLIAILKGEVPAPWATLTQKFKAAEWEAEQAFAQGSQGEVTRLHSVRTG